MTCQLVYFSIHSLSSLHVSCIKCHYGRNFLNSPWKRDKIRWWEINVYFCKWISNTTTSINWADLCRWYFRFIIGCAQHIYIYIHTQTRTSHTPFYLSDYFMISMRLWINMGHRIQQYDKELANYCTNTYMLPIWTAISTDLYIYIPNVQTPFINHIYWS